MIYGVTPLYAASHNGHLDVVQCLVREGKAAVNQAHDDGATPLSMAAHEGHLEVVQYLGREGKAAVNQAYETGETPLWMASGGGHLEIVQWLVREGKAAVNQASVEGATPLWIASAAGHLEVVQWLVREGKATVNNAAFTSDMQLYTPLDAATRWEHDMVVLFLLSNGAHKDTMRLHFSERVVAVAEHWTHTSFLHQVKHRTCACLCMNSFIFYIIIIEHTFKQHSTHYLLSLDRCIPLCALGS